MNFFAVHLALVAVMVTGAGPAAGDVHDVIDAHMATLRKRHRKLNNAQLKDMAIANLYGPLPETKFTMPPYEDTDYRRLTPLEIVRLSYSEHPTWKNADLLPPIHERLSKGHHQVDPEWITKQLSNLRRQAKDARWEEYQRFTRS